MLHSYEPGFKLTLGLKDVNLALDEASKSGITLAAAIVRGAMMDAVGQGLGNHDWSVLARMVQQRAALRK